MEVLRTGDLRPISLEELNAAASLLTRVDRKYLVPAHVAQGLVQALAPRARVLEIEGTRSFSYARPTSTPLHWRATWPQPASAVVVSRSARAATSTPG